MRFSKKKKKNANFNSTQNLGPNKFPVYMRSSCSIVLICLFVCFVALRPKSTAMVIAVRSVHLTTLFPGQA